MKKKKKRPIPIIDNTPLKLVPLTKEDRDKYSIPVYTPII